MWLVLRRFFLHFQCFFPHFFFSVKEIVWICTNISLSLTTIFRLYFSRSYKKKTPLLCTLCTLFSSKLLRCNFNGYNIYLPLFKRIFHTGRCYPNNEPINLPNICYNYFLTAFNTLPKFLNNNNNSVGIVASIYLYPAKQYLKYLFFM